MTISFKNISKEYAGKKVLDEVSFDIASREFFVLAGSSGGGKTTLLKMINRLIEPSAGEVLIDNEAVKSLDLRELRLDIGYVLQQGALFPNMTVLENIGLIPTMKKWPKEQILERVSQLLPLAGLDPDKYLTRYPRELSGGEAQRIGILRAFAGEPKIILMDEPFSALDPISRQQLQELTRSIQQKFKTTTVFVTHDMGEAMKLADHIAVVREGHLQQIGTPDEIFHAPANDYVADFFKNYQQDLSNISLSNLTEFLQQSDGKFDQETALNDVLKALTQRETSVKFDRKSESEVQA